VIATDGFHAEADRAFRHAITARIPLVTTNLVVAEVHRLVLLRAGVRAASVLLERLEASPLTRIVFAGPEEHRAALGWLRQLSDQRITYTDAVSFAVMQSLRSSAALSFDRDFLVAGFQLWRGES
jgi:predicted nucleic acid-binding protein